MINPFQLRRRLVVIVWIACLSVFSCLGADPPPLKAGFAKAVITPDQPVRLAGYANRTDLSAGVHDDLTARVLVLELNGSRLALVSVDLIGFYGDTAEPLRKAILERTGLKPAELLLAAIHTHSGPGLGLDPQKSHPNNVQYTEQLRGKLAELVAKGLQALQPASVSVGTGSAPVGSNRRELRIDSKGESAIVLGRNPYGPTDKEVQVLKISKPDGSPLGVVFDYATHATSLGPGNLTISGDVLGLAEQMIEKVTDSGGIALAFAGASGNIDPWFRIVPGFNTEPGWTPEPVLLGNLLGQEVVHVYRKATEVKTLDVVRTSSRVIKLPAKAAANAPAASNGAVLDSIPYVISAAKVGDIGIIGLGGEVCTEIGLAIKAGSPARHTLVITHCNGAAGYLVPKHLYVEGGYEVRTTPFAPEAADMVVRESLSALHDLW